MSSTDFLNYVLAFGIIIVVFLFAYLVYCFVKVLESVKSIMENISQTSREVTLAKENLKYGVLNMIGKFLSAISRKGGETNG